MHCFGTWMKAVTIYSDIDQVYGIETTYSDELHNEFTYKHLGSGKDEEFLTKTTLKMSEGEMIIEATGNFDHQVHMLSLQTNYVQKIKAGGTGGNFTINCIS